MKKTAIIAGAGFFCLFAASVYAQTPAVDSMPASQSMTTTDEAQLYVSTDKWNNWDPAKYAMLPMPEPLTIEKIFPVIGTYTLNSQEGAAGSEVTIALDPENKGIAWIEGLPEGKTKLYLTQSPATYKIPPQKTDSDKELTQGVLIYDRETNNLNICIGCAYDKEDPASVFLPQEPASDKETKKSTKKIKPVFYSANKVIEEEEPMPEETMEPKPVEQPAEPVVPMEEPKQPEPSQPVPPAQ